MTINLSTIAGSSNLTLSTTVNNAASAATASVLMKRDINGRAQVVSPSAASDIAIKSYVDSAANMAISGTTQTANFTAVGNTHYAVDLSSGSIKCSLPDATNIAGQQIEIYIKAVGSGNALYFDVVVGGQTINEQTANTYSKASVAELYGVIQLRALGSTGYRVVGRS